MTRLTMAAGLALAPLAICFAQNTEPIKPKTPDILVPPPVEVPGPPNIDALAAKPLPADAAARIAILRQQTIALARAAIRAAAGGRKSAQAALGPNVSLDSAATKLTVVKVDPNATGSGAGTLNGSQSSISLRQLLFDFSHSEDLVRQAAYLEEAARRAYETSEDDLVSQVKQAFYTFVQDNSLVDAADANVRNTQAQLDLAQARLDSGLGAPADVVSAKTLFAIAVVALTQARETAASSRIALATIMGLDPRTPITAAASAEESPVAEDMNALVDQALKLRPEVAQSTAVLKAAQAGLSAARTGNAPALILNAAYSGRGSSDPLAGENTTVGVALSWTLFDSGNNAGRVEQAKAGVEAAKAQLDLTSQSVVGDVAQAYLNLKSGEQRAIVTTANLANAQEGVRLSQGRYRAGVTTFLEVSAAQASLFTAQTNDVNAHAAIQQARAALAKAVGRRVWRT